VQWTGPSPPQSTGCLTADPNNWDKITYKYDPSGRRIKKLVVSLSNPYIYGPGVDQPVCMIEVADSNAAYYYHFDGLGSVVALSDSDGDTVQTYEYSVYGQVAASDPNHTNPFLFTGRRFDIETGLYYYRARYYNPYIGRFLQTDPVGYDDGINWYVYCKNNPVVCVDLFGLISVGLYDEDPCNPGAWRNCADDFDYWFEIDDCQDVLDQLEALRLYLESQGIPWCEVTAIYIFDHSVYDPETNKTWGLQFGDEIIDIREQNKFWGQLGAVLPPECAIHLRHCNVAEDITVLRNLAKWTDHPVSGCAGRVAPTSQERQGPDYTMYGDLWIVYPGNAEICLWRAYVWEYPEWFYWLPWGPNRQKIPNPEPQPY